MTNVLACKAVLCALLMALLQPLSAQTEKPLVPAPRLTYLDTNLGLDQDTIEDIYVDKQGFIWVATSEGLNRFDGVKNLKIRGLNNELSSNSVYDIFEHSSGLLILSTVNSGIVALDRNTQAVSTILAVPFKNSPQWLQHGNSTVELANGDLVVALNESIFQYSLDNKRATELFKLSDDLIDNGHHFRDVFYSKDSLIIASSNGLIALDAETGIHKSLINGNDTFDDETNVKLLKSFDNDSLYVGTVKGLYKFSLGEIENYLKSNWETPSHTVINEHRNVWDMAVESTGQYAYIGTDTGVYRLDLISDDISFLFEPTKNYEILSKPVVKNIALDQFDNVWFGTIYSGAMLWSANSLLFDNVYNSIYAPEDSLLTNNAVWSIYQYDADTLFVGTLNGLNEYSLSTGIIKKYETNESESADYSEAEITEIYSTERGFLWLVTQGGIRYFDINKGEYVPPPVVTTQAKDMLDKWSYSLAFQDKNKIWSITDSGMFMLDRSTELVTEIDTEAFGLSYAQINTFVGFDKRTNTILVGASNELWGINLNDFSGKLLHTIIHESRNRYVYPDTFLRGFDNTVWLSYPGHGLYKLDGSTLKTIDSYSLNNLLPTDLIYGLSLDIDGDLWFSSHSGIYTLNTKTLEVLSFGFLNGLASSEFNQGAAENLTDSRIAYGSNLGFSLFHPLDLKSTIEVTQRAPTFTEANLINRKLQLPLSSLNGKTLELKHDDYGLTLNYSALSFDRDANKMFNYRIKSGKEVLNYPGMNIGKISLPTLNPGMHEIEIYKPGVNAQQNVARLTIKVNYPPFASPLAYLIYTIIFVLIGSVIFARRKKMNLVLEQANQQVKVYNKRLTEALVASSSNIWEWDSVNEQIQGERIAKDVLADAIDDKMDFTTYVSYIHEEDRAHYLSLWRSFLRQEDTTFDVSYRVIAKNGKVLWYRDIGSINETSDGVYEVRGTYTNLTDKVANQEKLKLFGNAFKHTRDWVLIFDKQRQFKAANPAFLKAFNIGNDNHNITPVISNEHQEILHRTTKKLSTMKAGERWKTELNIELEGKSLSVLTDYNAVADEKAPDIIDYFLIIGTDITEQISAQKELQKLANYDVLTGLVNRTLLIERLKHSINFAKRYNKQLAILFIDLDGFKPINDSFGHIAGDTVLTEISQRLRGKFRDQDSVARLGGDEFVVVLEEINDVHAVDQIVLDLLHHIELPISIGKQKVSVSASIGVALYPDDATDAEHLLTNADIAMYNAKESGKNRHQYYTAQMNEKVQATTILQNRIKVAVAQNEFVNFYQPIIDLETGHSAGFELLLRWFDNEKFISPGVFIPIMEQIGCIVEVTMKAMERAISDLANWYNAGFKGYVAINLSAKQFSKRPEFETILHWLHKHKLPVSCLRFEITEGLLVDNSASTLEYMHEMRASGFKIALDDFGTGYSSLKYIKDFPLDVLKIDRSFVQDVTLDKGTESIVQSTLIMTQLLGLDTVAEGVETLEQLTYFSENGCRYIQGFYFAKPMPFEQIDQVLNKNWLLPDN